MWDVADDAWDVSGSIRTVSASMWATATSNLIIIDEHKELIRITKTKTQAKTKEKTKGKDEELIT